MTAGKRTVFLVCDYPAVREGLVLLINREPDLEVAAATEFNASAVRTVSELKPDIALIDLPDNMKHLELIRKMASTSPVLVLSVYKETFHAEHVMRAGAGGYVLKLESASALMNAIRRVMNGRIYVSREVSAVLVGLIRAWRPGKAGGAKRLSNREIAVLREIGEGLTTRQIGDKLCISIKTVETHRAHIKTKLNIKTCADLLQYAIKWANHSS